jgi:hypothetical protein
MRADDKNAPQVAIFAQRSETHAVVNAFPSRLSLVHRWHASHAEQKLISIKMSRVLFLDLSAYTPNRHDDSSPEAGHDHQSRGLKLHQPMRLTL